MLRGPTERSKEGGNVQAARPRPAELQHLRPSNLAGALAVAAVALTTGLGIALAMQPHALAWAAGQLVQNRTESGWEI